MAERLLALGVDGARGGWVVVSCQGQAPADISSRHTAVKLCPSFAEVVGLRGESDAVVAVDIPMGLLGSVDFRPCDSQARALLKHRRDTVFAPPSRPLLAAASYAEARASIAELRQTEPKTKSLSAQAFALAPKIKEVDDFLRSKPSGQAWLFEVHPELSFRAIANGRILDDKKTAHGQVDRFRLVCGEFPDAADAIAETQLSARDAQLADVLDAYAAAESALHVAAGDYEELGGEADSTGLVMRIVF